MYACTNAVTIVIFIYLEQSIGRVDRTCIPQGCGIKMLKIPGNTFFHNSFPKQEIQRACLASHRTVSNSQIQQYNIATYFCCFCCHVIYITNNDYLGKTSSNAAQIDKLQQKPSTCRPCIQASKTEAIFQTAQSSALGMSLANSTLRTRHSMPNVSNISCRPG